MALIDDVKGEILQKRGDGVSDHAGAIETAEAPKRQRRQKTPEEIEAYRAKKIAEEEARYLSNGKASDEKKVVKRENAKDSSSKVHAKQRGRTKTKIRPPKLKVEKPRVLQPLEPLYLLRIPGLPKGDCIAICYARGADL